MPGEKEPNIYNEGEISPMQKFEELKKQAASENSGKEAKNMPPAEDRDLVKELEELRKAAGVNEMKKTSRGDADAAAVERGKRNLGN